MVREALLNKTPLLAGLVRCLVGVVESAAAAAAKQTKRAGCSEVEGKGERGGHR